MTRCSSIPRAMAFGLALAIIGCSGGKGLELSYDGASKKALDVQSAHAFASTKTFSWPDGKGGFAQAKAASYHLFVANFPLDPAQGMNSLGKPLSSEGQMRVQLALVGDDGTEAGGKKNDPLAAGDYQPTAEKFRDVDYVKIEVFEGGKVKELSLNETKVTGKVKVTACDGQRVRGEIDLQEGANAIRGSFDAQIGK